MVLCLWFFFFKQKTAYEMRISDWSSDVCSSDLIRTGATRLNADSSLQCRADAGFGAWLAASGGSLAVTTYQAHKLLLIGWNGRQLSFLPRQDRKSVG